MEDSFQFTVEPQDVVKNSWLKLKSHLWPGSPWQRYTEQKAKVKAYADNCRARYSEVAVGDQVLLRQDKSSK